MKQEIRRILDVFYPRRCPVCDGIVPMIEMGQKGLKEGGLIHDGCALKIKYVRGHTCMKCGKQLRHSDDSVWCSDCQKMRHYFKRNFGVFDYRSISGSIYRFKYMGRQEYADFYAAATVKSLGRKLGKLHIDGIVPVPMYEPKKSKRGYNQAEVYAKRLSELTGIPLYKDLVVRTRDTRPMKQLDIRGRRNNLKKAFNIAVNDVKLRCVLIIDDIYTTGSTIDEIAHEFQMAGVEEIYSLTVAIGQTT